MEPIRYSKPVLWEELSDEERLYILENCVIEEKLDGHLSFIKEDKFIIFIEDLRICHTILYRIPAPAIALDIYNLESKRYLPLKEKYKIMLKLGFLPPPVLHIGSVDDPYKFLKSRSAFAIGINPKVKMKVNFSVDGVVLKRYGPKTIFAKIVNDEFEIIRGTFDFRKNPINNEIYTFSFEEFKKYWQRFGISSNWQDYFKYLERCKILGRI